MDTKATVQSLMDAVQMGDFEKAKSTLADDFKFSGPVPEPIGSEEWISMIASMKTAFPNRDYKFNIESVDGNTAHISAELSGTHSGELDLTSMGMGVIPATNKSFETAHNNGKVTVNGDMVVSFAMEPTKDAGLMAILGQLDIKTPAM